MSQSFSKNLRSLCADYSSIAQVCRDIGLNRQQFDRYLNGGGMPSAHNLRRIAQHFEVSESDLMMDSTPFAQRYLHLPGLGQARKNPATLVSNLFSNQTGSMRRYLGFYHGHFITPTWEGKIMRTLVWLREQDGYVVTHTFERALEADKGIIQKTRYSGLAAYRGNRIYVVESANSEDGFLSESILFPAHRRKVTHLEGMTLGVATYPRLAPYSSPVIWTKIPEKTSARDALKATGIFALSDTKIEIIVRNHFNTAGKKT